MSDDELSAMSVKQLKAHIASAGLSFRDCVEKSDLVARAKEGSTALVAMAPKGGKELVVALLDHASKALNVDMAPFIEAHVDAFVQSATQLQSGHGETFEQYDIFRAFQAQLEVHFDTFVSRHGFSSAEECFAAIDAAVSRDTVEQKEQMAQMEQQLQAMQQQWMAAMQQQMPGGAFGEPPADIEEIVPDMLPVTIMPEEESEAPAPEPPRDGESELEREQREIREAMDRRKKAREDAMRKAHAPPTVEANSDGTVPEAFEEAGAWFSIVLCCFSA